MNGVVATRALGAATERVSEVPSREVLRSTWSLALPIESCALVPARNGERGWSAIDDGNRSVIVPEMKTTFAGREWMLSIKGIGASTPAYGALERLADSDRVLTTECWMGDAPYGGQGDNGARDAHAISSLADADGRIEGVSICPVVAVVEVPEHRVERDAFWYRRYRGSVLQEHRLVPSDVRLFHGGESALGRDAERALIGLGASSIELLDAFVDRYLASGIAALTLWARTARECPDGFEGLDYDDVWLDKDSLIGTDGTIFLVDLESVEWTPSTHRMGIEKRIRRQIDRNYYELMYGLDAILDVRDRWLERETDRRARRESMATRIALALAEDRYVKAIESADGVDLVVRAPDEPVRVRFLDRR